MRHKSPRLEWMRDVKLKLSVLPRKRSVTRQVCARKIARPSWEPKIDAHCMAGWHLPLPQCVLLCRVIVVVKRGDAIGLGKIAHVRHKILEAKGCESDPSNTKALEISHGNTRLTLGNWDFRIFMRRKHGGYLFACFTAKYCCLRGALKAIAILELPDAP